MRRAVVSYATDATQGEKEQALLGALALVIAELLEDHGWTVEDLTDRCTDEIETLADELAGDA